MKRDFDLIRRIMTDIEAMPAGEKYKHVNPAAGYDSATVYAHVDLLLKAGLVEGDVTRDPGGAISGMRITGLTWSGHDFLDAAKDDTIWNKAKESVLKPGASITFGLLLEWLKAEAKQKLGIP